MIKGNKFGIIVSIKEESDFEAVKEEIILKIKDSSKFFKSASVAITFEGKRLSTQEQQEIVDIISANSDLNIVCILDSADEEKYKVAVETVMNPPKEVTVSNEEITEAALSGITGGQFYRGTLRSGQVLESDSSIVILGDVNPGAKIISGGSVVVLGSVKGTIYAGISGDAAAFVVGLDMFPQQIRIGDTIARCSDKPKKSSKPETKIAYVDDGNIYIEPLSKEVLNDIKL
ncbi:MAG: septum site-determining protein MinC [Clostridiales bacterium]|nr:septum site-determining protein MinC [Clostridiales bacterium]